MPGPPGLLAGLIAVAGGLAAWWWPRSRYRHWRYQVAPDALELRHGVVRRIHSAIPYFRVQHIDVAQGPVERAVGLSRLVLHTASAGTDATIPGIAAGDAEGCAASSWPGPATAMRSEDPGPPPPDQATPEVPERPQPPGPRGRARRRGAAAAARAQPGVLRHPARLAAVAAGPAGGGPAAVLAARPRRPGTAGLEHHRVVAPHLRAGGRGPAGRGGRAGPQAPAVPFDRIQQVELVRKPLHRLLGVASLRVETAGGGTAAEVDLDVVTLAEAQALRASLLRAKAQLAAAPPARRAPGPPRPAPPGPRSRRPGRAGAAAAQGGR